MQNQPNTAIEIDEKTYFPPWIEELMTQNAQQIRLDIFRLAISRELQDVVFMAIDFECLGRMSTRTLDSSPNSYIQMGVAILDTRELLTVDPENVISTHLIVTGKPYLYHLNVHQNNFVFGDETYIKTKDLLKTFKSIIPKERKIAIVAHNCRGELNALRWMGFDLSSIEYIFDAQPLTQAVPYSYPPSLRASKRILQRTFPDFAL